MTIPDTHSSVVAQTSPTRSVTADDRSMVFETLRLRKEGPVLFAEIAAPPMNLLGPGLVRDLVALIQRAEADDAIQVLVFKSADPDYFISHVKERVNAIALASVEDFRRDSDLFGEG